MELDFLSFAFNLKTETPGNTASWGTSLGQSAAENYIFTDIIDEKLLKGLVYNKVSENDIEYKFGRPGSDANYEIQLASLFKEVYVNDELIDDAQFMLIINKEHTQSHDGRLNLKYNLDFKYNGNEINRDCINKIINKYNWNENSAWFISEINSLYQKDIRFTAYCIDENNEVVYSDTENRKKTIQFEISRTAKNLNDCLEKKNEDFITSILDIIKPFMDDELLNELTKVQTGICLYPVLAKIDNLGDSNELQEKGNPAGSGFRYYKYIKNDGTADKDKLFEYNNSYYLICNDWYDDKEGKKGNKPKFIEWIKKEISNRFTIDLEKISLFKAKNEIYYGVPGCGKSYTIDKNDYIEKTDDNPNGYVRKRTVFHPDYTYSDFVGQVVPVINYDNQGNKIIGYEFKAGPFCEILYEALENRNVKHVLIIEEINRGNASAIFGDLFQLLDRENGKSSYIVANDVITEYLAERYYDEHYVKSENSNKTEEIDSLKKKYHDIYIPENLWLVGTMNTCDQNVFPLDTAFKRRWELKRIKNEFKNTKEDKDFKITHVCGSNITWEKFNEVINNAIMNKNRSINTDDKRLGVHFVSKEELSDRNKFAEKVLMYIWNDVAKLNPKDFFKLQNFDKMIDEFTKEDISIDDAFKAVFNEKIYDELFDVKKENTTPINGDIEPVGESGENN